jgi:hypothetical protein
MAPQGPVASVGIEAVVDVWRGIRDLSEHLIGFRCNLPASPNRRSPRSAASCADQPHGQRLRRSYFLQALQQLKPGGLDDVNRVLGG